MARNDNVVLTPGAWTQLTNADAAAIRVQSRSGWQVLLQATNGGTAPSSTDGGIELAPGSTLAADLSIADLWPGVSGANRLWALSDLAITLSVSHA